MSMSDLISRQAAIDEITEYGSGDTIYMSAAELKRRIEHLPSAQPETHEERTETHACDCISRREAIDAIVNELDNIDHVPEWVFDRIKSVFHKLPSAQPERKTGRWVKDRLTALNGGSYEVFRCSECQSAFNWRMAYCGHCGAKMEVGHG